MSAWGDGFLLLRQILGTCKHPHLILQRKIVIHVQLKGRSLGHCPQTRVLPVGSRDTANPACNWFRQQELSWWVSPRPLLCPRFPTDGPRQLPFSLWDAHLLDLKHQTLFFLQKCCQAVPFLFHAGDQLPQGYTFWHQAHALWQAESCLGEDRHEVAAIPQLFCFTD